MELGGFMKNNIVYRVRDIKEVLKNFTLTTQDIIFIVKNTYKITNGLRFFIIENDNKLSLYAKRDFKDEVYKLNCPEISSIYIKDLILKRLISNSMYKIHQINSEKYMEYRDRYFPIRDIPLQHINIKHTNKGKYDARIYIKNEESPVLCISSLDDDIDLAQHKLLKLIYRIYNLYLDKESEEFNARREYIKTKISKRFPKITRHTNLDLIKEKYNTILDSSEELDIEPET